MTALSHEEKASRIRELNDAFRTASLTSVPNSFPASGGVTNNLALTQHIDNLDGTHIARAVITDATISGGNVTATSFSGLLGVGNGGTGTSSAPSYGQMLVGNSAGGYDLLATSSLGISAGGIPGGSDTYVQFNNGDVFGGVSSFTFASSTGLLTVPFASTTALTISGTASTSLFFANGLTTCNSNNNLTWLDGTFGCEPDDTSAGAANPFSWEQNYAIVNAATSSIFWAKNGVNASSTSHFATAIFDIASSTNASSTFLTTRTQWFTGLTNSGLGVDANGKVYAAATSTLATISGTLALTQLANQNPNTVLANATGGSAAPTAIATSSLFGTGTGGTVLAWNAGVPQWIATTTLTNGAGITTTYSAANNQWTITNTGATFAFPFTTLATYGTTTAATSSSIQTAGVFFASSTAAASVFPFASSTALSAGTLCLSTDCRTSWPTGGGSSDPFTHETWWGQSGVSATTSALHLTGSPFSLFASSTAVFELASSTAASTTRLTTGTQWFTTFANSGLGVDANGKVYAAATSTLASISGTLALTQLANQNANTVLANPTGASAAPTAVGTSSLFAALDGQVLGRVNGAWIGVATTTFSTGLTYASGAVACDTASHTTLGCLSTTDWDTFSGKENVLTFSWPLIRATNAISFGGLSTSSPIAAASGLLYATGVNTVASISTSSAVTMSITGNAGTATTLQTPRAINGVDFDGSQPITIFAASSTLLANTNTWSGTNIFSNAPKLAALTGLVAGNAGALYQVASSSLFGFTPASSAITISTTFPLSGGGDLSGDRTLTFSGLSTSTNAVQGNIPYFSGANTFANVATTSLGISAPITFSGTLGSQIGGVAGTFGCTSAFSGVTGCLTGTDWTTFNNKQAALAFTYPLQNAANTISLAFGTSTTNTWAHQIFSSLFATNASTTNATTTNLHITGLTNSGLGVDANGKVYAAATSTLANISGTLALTQLANQNANTVLANFTGGSAAPTAIATSSFFGTGTGGYVLAWNAGVPQWIATTTLTNGAGITTTYSAANNQWTITNTGGTFAFPFTTIDTFGTTSAATSSSIQTAGVFFASSTAAASQFPFASSTALSAGTLCLSTDCRTSWPTGGGSSDPFTHETWWGQSGVSATTSALHLTGSPFSLFASSTAVFEFASSTAASTTRLTAGTQWFTGLTNSGLGVDANGKVYAAATSTLANIGGVLALTSLANQNANTVLANATGGSAAPTAISTTSLFAGFNGQVLAFSNGAWTGVATTTNSCSSGIACTFSAGSWSFTDTDGYPFASNTTFATTTAATTTSIWTRGVFFASSTSAYSVFQGGFLSLASSTIGNGTQTGGLTISGGATTTGNAYFAGNIGIGSTSPNYALDVNGDVNVASGKCFRVNGVCIGYTVKLAAIYATSTPGTNAQVVFTGAQGAAPSFSAGTLTLPSNTSYIVTEVWGGGGGGSGGGAGAGSGGAGNSSCFGTNSTACTSPAASATGGGAGVFASTGGAGGAGSDGDIKLTGGGGGGSSDTSSSNNYFGGGVGGSSPRGGGGGQSPTTAAGGAGAAYGGGGAGGGLNNGLNGTYASGNGGGAGGYAQKLITNPSGTYYYTVGPGGTAGTAGTAGYVGGVGGAGGLVITVYATSSPTAAGNDYAEMFPVSNPGIIAGDIVAVDAGVPVSMKLAAAGEGAPLAGIIATNPGQVLGDTSATGQRPVALSGRVPTKVNLEGGPIAVGDRIAPSSVSGVGKKAGPFDDSVGIALESFSGAAGSSQGSVTVFLDLQRGIDIDQIGMTLLGTSPTSTPGTPFDFVGDLLSSIISRIAASTASTSDATSTSATSTAATSTSAISTPSIADSFLGALFSRIAQWFADAANGITNLFADTFHARKEICIQKSDGADACVTGDQLAAVLSATNQTPQGNVPLPTPASADPPPTDTVTSTAATSSPPTSEPSTSLEPTEAATSSPAVTEPTQPASEQIVDDSPPLAPEQELEPTPTTTIVPDEPAPTSQ